MNVFELVGKLTLQGQDKINKDLTKLEKNTQKLQKGLKVAGAAFTAMGVAGLAVIQTTKKINAQLSVTALNLGITKEEMRALTLAVTNVTFPIDEVTASFDLLARAGVKDTEVLKETATAFDTLGDATGYSASQVTGFMVPAMKTFGLSAEEMAKKTDIMTFMSRKSTMSLEDFNTMVGYTTPELVAQGLTIEGLTAALIHMERQGYAPGRVMTREFMKATTLAQKENISLTEALGMTADELAGYIAEMEGAVGMTQEYADVANEQFTIMDKLKQKFSEITLGMSGFLEPLEPILASMTVLGPVMLIVATNTKLATLATHAFGVAFKIALGPIGLITMAIVALALAWKNNWGDIRGVTETVVEAIVHGIGWLWDKIMGVVQKIVDAIAWVMREIAKFVNIFSHDWAMSIWDAANSMSEAVEDFRDRSVSALQDYDVSFSQVAEETQKHGDKISSIYAKMAEATEGVTEKQRELARETQESFRKQILAVEQFNEAFRKSLEATQRTIRAQIANLWALYKAYGPSTRTPWGELAQDVLAETMRGLMPPGDGGGFMPPVGGRGGIGSFQGGGVIEQPTLALLGEQAPRIKEFVFNEKQLGMLNRGINVYISGDIYGVDDLVDKVSQGLGQSVLKRQRMEGSVG